MKANKSWLTIADPVARALAEGRPVAALESTVIAHGLPFPANLETALACEEAVQAAGAVPATIGIIDGLAVIGLTSDEIELFSTPSTAHPLIEKVGLSNLAAVLSTRKPGATTAATSLKLARLAGIRVFSTGGIGGVHRGAAESFDVSGDLTALASTPAVCVCSGAKAILDLPKTVEYLETLGVPVVGYGTDEFPAFYSRKSGLRVEVVARTPEDAARIASLHWETGASTAVLVCAPVPDEFEVNPDQVEQAITKALALSERSGISGKAVTPFVLAQMERLTEGRSLKANCALLVNNATLAAIIARNVLESHVMPLP